MNYNYFTSILQNAVKHYPGGITSVAIMMNKSPNILSNKLNVNIKSHLLSLEEAAEIIDITQDKEVVESLASLVNSTVIDISKHEINKKITNEKKLLGEFIILNSKCAALGEQIIQAHAEDSPSGMIITNKEEENIKKELRELIKNAFKIQLMLEKS